MPDFLVCITFDYDNVSSTIARGGITPTLLSRGEFGVTGASRIVDLLAAEQVPSTWFIPGHTIETYPASVAAVRDAGCEIEHHGWTHRVPSTLTREQENEELVRGIEAIQTLTGRRPIGYRSPAWDLSPAFGRATAGARLRVRQQPDGSGHAAVSGPAGRPGRVIAADGVRSGHATGRTADPLVAR